MQADKRECAQCGQTVTGRKDKQYCSSQCRAAASNSRKADDAGERLMREINNRLRHNRQVLRREVLQQQGFDFRHFTHLYRTKNGNTYHFCYDYGYLLLEEEKVLIVNWQPYMAGN